MFFSITPLFQQIPGTCEFKVALINNSEITKQAKFTHKILEKP